MIFILNNTELIKTSRSFFLFVIFFLKVLFVCLVSINAFRNNANIMGLKLFLLANIWYIIECDPGFYGIKCSDVCSEHCADPMSCDHVNGSCMTGCQDGFLGSKCTESKYL